MKLLCCAVAVDVVAICEISFGPMSLNSTGTHHAKRCKGPASQGKRVHFREGRKNVLRSVQKIVVEGPETRRAAAKPKQNKRSPQGGGEDPKQCPGDAQSMGRREKIHGMHQEIARGEGFQ
jgi:hypothetical protein